MSWQNLPDAFLRIDELADGIYECIKETTTTFNDSACFKNISNKNNSDRLDNLIKIRSNNKGVLTYEKTNQLIIEDLYYNVETPCDSSGYGKIPRNLIKTTNILFVIGRDTGIGGNPISVYNIDSDWIYFSYIPNKAPGAANWSVFGYDI